MRIDILTVFPDMVEAALGHGIVQRARDRGLVTIRVTNIRDYAGDRHHTTDDTPYGGGGGMVMKIDPIARAIDALSDGGDAPARIVLTDPRGRTFDQEIAREWAGEPWIVLICGHYEGVDERVRRHLVTDEVSIGDYILTGGELPALVVTDALTRLQPDALGDSQGAANDTFADGLLEYPHYTRPREYRGWGVPDILLCGHHAEIQRWRRWHQLQDTARRRPDLMAVHTLTAADRVLLASREPVAPPEKERPSRPANTDSKLDCADLMERNEEQL